MAKYNLYKILPEKRFELIEKLRAEGVEMAKKVEADGCVLEFLYSRDPDGSDIWWVKTYRDFLDGIESPKNISYCAAFFIYNDDFCYAVALGRTYMQIKNYCDPDFGINMACRIAADRVKIKNSKFFKSRRNRVTSSYQLGNRIEFDSGESLDFIRAATIDPTVWGTEANFGTAVQFSMNLAPDQLPLFCKKIEEVLAQPLRMELPKVVAVRDAMKLKYLDAKLVQTLGSEEHSKVVLVANENCQYSFYVQGAYGNLSEKCALDKKSLQNFFNLQNINLIEQINDIKVRVYDPEGHERSKSLKALIDFSDSEERTALIDGKWYRYNPSFVNSLRREADSIPAQKGASNDAKDIDDFVASFASSGFTDCRKAIARIDSKYRVNKLDLYKDGTLYFVKFGAIEAPNYAIDQAIHAAKYLQANHGQLDLEGQPLEVEKICLWLVDRDGAISGKISQIGSLNFLMKVADFKHSVLSAGFRPRIMIS
ncbi:MAG: TIGR04141 family sporadically distributed protein [Candidatus Pacebacteria bacterium]|jgi:uncharacterized protein (TIGR04141 family)|nr:TIGR04141 family sporadically distributed protein [Candidatus Paceibacterota bacterium]